MTDALSIASLLVTATKQLQSTLQSPHADNAKLDVELLLCHCLQKARTYLYAWPEHTLTDKQHTLFQSLLERRANGEPLAYLTGAREFWSLSFEVTPDTLIPRPDTEILVELCLSKLTNAKGPFLDLGTGSGVIAICVAIERPELTVTATDNSHAALKVATANATRLNARVSFKESNWFENITPDTFSVIASNPPYIAEDDPHLTTGGLPFEPIRALRSCDNGLGDITAIIKDAPVHLHTGGWLLLEHGHAQGQHTRNLMLERGFRQVTTEQDLSGNDRVTLGQKV